MRELSDSLLERRLIETDGTGLAGRRVELVGLQATITDVLVRVRLRDGTRTTTLVHPSQPWIEVAAPRELPAVAAGYVVSGVHHILLGVDHLLFVLGLLLIVRGPRGCCVKTISAFTRGPQHHAGHRHARLRQRAGAAAQRRDRAVDPLPRPRDRAGLAGRDELHDAPSLGGRVRLRPAARLRLRQRPHHDGAAGAEIPLALLMFNVGVELGQLVFVGRSSCCSSARSACSQVRWPRAVEMLPGYAVGSLGAYWTIQRVALLLAGGTMSEPAARSAASRGDAAGARRSRAPAAAHVADGRGRRLSHRGAPSRLGARPRGRDDRGRTVGRSARRAGAVALAGDLSHDDGAGRYRSGCSASRCRVSRSASPPPPSSSAWR